MSDVAALIDHMLATEAADYRAGVDELRQEAWVAALEAEGDPAEAIRKAWRKATHGNRVKTVSLSLAVDGDAADSRTLADVIEARVDVEDVVLSERPVVDTSGVDKAALALVEAVMLDGVDFDDARQRVCMGPKTAQLVMNRAGLTRTGRRLHWRRPVEGLVSLSPKRISLEATARAAGMSYHQTDRLLTRWSAAGVVAFDRGPTGFGRRRIDELTLLGVLMLVEARRRHPDELLPRDWPGLLSILRDGRDLVVWRPGDRWLKAKPKHGAWRSMRLVDLRRRAAAAAGREVARRSWAIPPVELVRARLVVSTSGCRLWPKPPLNRFTYPTVSVRTSKGPRLLSVRRVLADDEGWTVALDAPRCGDARCVDRRCCSVEAGRRVA